MSMRSLVRAGVLMASVAILLAIPASASGAATAEVRVLGPDFDLEQAFFVTGTANIPTDPDADCFFGGTGGSGDPVTLSGPTALGAVKHASNWHSGLLPFSITDEFEFGLGVCGFGGHESDASTFWYVKVDHKEPTTGGDQVELENGDRVLWYLSPSNFPNPNPAELILVAPASAEPAVPFQVAVTEWTCTTDFPSTCTQGPANNAQVRVNGVQVATTNASGLATVTLPASSTLRATRGAEIPSKTVPVCVEPASGDDCPPPDGRGRTIFGREKADQVNGTAGWDEIRSGSGSDTVDIRQGGRDKVFCGQGSHDLVIGVGSKDEIASSCERIRRS